MQLEGPRSREQHILSKFGVQKYVRHVFFNLPSGSRLYKLLHCSMLAVSITHFLNVGRANQSTIRPPNEPSDPLGESSHKDARTLKKRNQYICVRTSEAPLV